jgi:hypothetical protein
VFPLNPIRCTTAALFSDGMKHSPIAKFRELDD